MLRLCSAADSAGIVLLRCCRSGCNRTGDLASQQAAFCSATQLAEASSEACHSFWPEPAALQSAADGADSRCGTGPGQPENSTRNSAGTLLRLATWHHNQTLTELGPSGSELRSRPGLLHGGALGDQRRSLPVLWSQQARHFAHRHGPKQRPEDQHLKLIRLVFEDGTHKVLPIGQAQSEAAKLKRDLIPTALHQDPPVYKLGLKDQIAIAEYKRQKERRKQEMEQRRRLVVKEIRVSADTQEHDLGFKLRQAQDFVEKNFRVKLEVKFTRWRSNDGTAKLRELVDRCSEWSTVTAPQVNEKLRRNTTAVYLTPKLGSSLPDGSPSSADPPSRPPGQQQSGQQPLQAVAS